MHATGETEILRGLCNKLPDSLHTTTYTRLIHLSTFLMDSDATMRRGRQKNVYFRHQEKKLITEKKNVCIEKTKLMFNFSLSGF